MLDIGSLRSRLLSASAIASVLSVAAVAASAGALPSGGHYVSGQGSINKASQSLTVKQSSMTGIINWSSFSIGGKNSVSFNNGSGATLNRVTGGNLSRIAGSLHATGSLYLMNSSGVIVSGTGRVVTGGSFVASTSGRDLDGDDSHLKLDSGKAVNKGTIIAGGTATLAGRVVTDTGAIHASEVDLEAGKKLTIDGNISAQNSDGSGGSVTARARTIIIDAAGAIDASATRTGQTGGTVSVVARGTTIIGGSINASGGKGGTGGFVETSGQHLHVAGRAKISTLAKEGKTGSWLIDPNNFTIAASGGDITGAALSTELANTSVTIESSQGSKAGKGDIFVNDAVSWTSDSTLTLDAYRNIVINAVVTVSGALLFPRGSTAGSLILDTGDQSQNGIGNSNLGMILFQGSGRINFPFVNLDGSQAGSLSINGNNYVLVNSISQLSTDIADNASGYYALAGNYDASADGTYASSPISTTFTGTFNGLGNTVSNLTIDDATNGDKVGLFSVIGQSALVSDLTLEGASVTVADDGYAGALAGENEGFIRKVTASGATDAGAEASVGGLVGNNGEDGDIRYSHATGSVTGGYYAEAGGLVGLDSGAILYSHATGTVEGGEESDAGGLVGFDMGTIGFCYSLDTVNGGLYSRDGGLIGSADGGGASYSYAEGAVSGSGFSEVGGLIGVLGENSEILSSSATGSVTGNSNNDVGGLAGINSGIIEASYSLSLVSSTDSSSHAGGLVGVNEFGATIDQSYAAGYVTGSDTNAGFVGENTNTSSTAITNSYWDAQTSGRSNGLGTGTAQAGLEGMTTAQLQSKTGPSGFGDLWKLVADGFPYLRFRATSGRPVIVSGTISGGASDAGIAVDVLVNGKSKTPLVSMVSGANGYYYEMLAPHTIASSGSDVLVYEASATEKGNHFEQGAKGSLTKFNLAGNTLLVSTFATSETSLLSAMKKALGTHAGSDILYESNGTFTSGIDLDLDLSAASFNLNEALNVGDGKISFDAAGSLSENSSGEIHAKALTGSSHGAVKLTGANTIANLGPFTTGNHAFSLTDDRSLTTKATVNAGTGALTLTTIGSGNSLLIKSKLDGGTVDLASAGEVSEAGSGAITASTILNVTAKTGISLTSSGNKIKKLGTDKTNSGPNKVTL